MKRSFAFIVFLVLVVACSTQRKLQSLIKGNAEQVQLKLGEEADFLPKVDTTSRISHDTLKVKDDEGNEMILMKAVKDEETGEMVAAEELAPATVTARFRNVAERSGKVDLSFQVIVPQSMRDSRWQLRFNPVMYVLGDSVSLEPVIITGSAYRKAQMRGYQLYDKFVSRIVQDSTKFINVRQLDIFLRRYIPSVYSYKSDTSYVSEKEFYSAYGLSERQAVDHYTNKYAKAANERRKARQEKMYHKYVKVPIVTEGIRLDTVMTGDNGDFIYNYVQTINSRPKLRKVDIILSGDILEHDECIYKIPASKPLTFYISSISAFVDETEHYLTKVISRRATANTESRIDFEVAKADVIEELGNNKYEIDIIKRTLASLVENSTYDLDSIIVCATASPEGSYKANASLAQRRSESVSSYFGRFVKQYRDSLITERGVFAEIGHEELSDGSDSLADIVFTPRSIPENWKDLYEIVDKDMVMNDGLKEEFKNICDAEPDLDKREHRLQQCQFYKYMKMNMYPLLRAVKFNFYLHRKGMVKDTVHTTVIDTIYMRGVQALKDMDYPLALSLLSSYSDFNAAVAYMGLERNATALKILLTLKPDDKINYLLAVLYSRSGDLKNAVEHYLLACKQNPSYVFRGNLDPEISALIKMYNLNSQEDDEVFK